MGWGHSYTVNEELGKVLVGNNKPSISEPRKPPWVYTPKGVNTGWKEFARELSKQNSEP